MDQHRHIALPQLYGAPAYARPPVVPAAPAPRPVSPDDLPIAAEMTAAELDLLASAADVDRQVPAAPDDAVPDGAAPVVASTPAALAPAPPLPSLQFPIRGIADRIRRLRP